MQQPSHRALLRFRPKKVGTMTQSSLPVDAAAELARAREEYAELQKRGYDFNLTRGKPSPDQLSLADDLLTIDVPATSADGLDVRNYGDLQGLRELREIFAPVLGVNIDQLAVGGNSSLELMHAVLTTCLLQGPAGAHTPWSRLNGVSILCPVPGYDRHFSVCESFGIRMIPVPMTEHGPDMDVVEKIAASDPAIKGIWCVPKYSNPTGVTYSDETVRRLAEMKTAASDFRIFWDNAYAVHHLDDQPDELADILGACVKADHGNRPIMFASTSKVTFAGSGVSFIAGSEETIAWWIKAASVRTIGPDKVNQWRHAHFLKNPAGLAAHMAKHAAIIKPKFDAVLEALEKELGNTGLATWTTPRGGYFISLDVAEGCASRVIQLAADAGVALTPAGSTFPLRYDPLDSNIRLAPTFPNQERVREAMHVVTVCIRLAGYEKLAAESSAS